MLLVYTQKITPRITYTFKHVCTRILGIKVGFTSVIEEFIAHSGAKLSYGKQPMGNELFIQSHGLLSQQGFESFDVLVKPWGETKCFFSVGEKSAVPFDIFSAAFYLLSRYEEYLPHVKDALGRYPVSESIGHKEDFLTQPVVDLWAYNFKYILSESFPQLDFPKQKMSVHNVLETRVPFVYKHRGVFRSMIGYMRDFGKFRIRNMFRRSKVLLTLRKDPYNTFEWIIDVVKKSSTKLSVFFMLGEAVSFEDNVNTQRNKFKLLVKYVSDYREIGLVFSYPARTHYEQLKKEKGRMEEITNRGLLSTMNAQYSVNLPHIYRNLVELEIERDFTMVYENTLGFRAGTCTPFLFYDLDYEIKTPLIIHPMAGTTAAFDAQKASEIEAEIENLLSAVQQVHGMFSLAFSNTDFAERTPNNELLKRIFSKKLQSYEAS